MSAVELTLIWIVAFEVQLEMFQHAHIKMSLKLFFFFSNLDELCSVNNFKRILKYFLSLCQGLKILQKFRKASKEAFVIICKAFCDEFFELFSRDWYQRSFHVIFEISKGFPSVNERANLIERKSVCAPTNKSPQLASLHV